MKTFPSEHEIQTAFVEWAHYNERRIPQLKLAFAVPNGGQRHAAIAAKLKAEGVRKGVPDYLIPCKSWNDRYIGLAIEFKAHYGRQTPDQESYSMKLVEAGWYYIVCKTVQEGMNIVEDYFNAH